MSKAPICSCGIQMVERRRKTDGKRFYGCAKFGKGGCGETADHEEAEANDPYRGMSYEDFVDIE